MKSNGTLKIEDHFRLIMDYAPDAVFIHDYEGNIIDANKKAAENVGYTLGQLKTMTVMDVDASFPDLKQLKDEWEKLENNKTIKLFGTHKKNDGSIFPVEIHLSSYIFQNEKLILAFVRDITERKKTDDALSKSEQMYKSLFSNMQSGFALHEMVFDDKGTPVDYIFLDVNEAFENQTGLQSADLIGKRVTEALPGIENDTVDWIGTYGKVVLSGKSINLENFSKPLNRWFSITAYRPDEGRFATVVNDITLQKQGQENLRASEKKLSTLFGSMTEMVVQHELVFNDAGEPINYRIIDCNKAFMDTTGIKFDDAVGKLATEVYGINEAPYLDHYSKVAISGKAYEFTTYYQPMDKHFMISVVSPQKNYFATITTDITAIKQIQEIVQAKNKELENYLYVASHDLRSPLVNIQGFSKILHEHAESLKDMIEGHSFDEDIEMKISTIFNEDLPRTLNFIHSGVSKMDKLISGLLKISRTGRMEMIIQKIDMNVLIKDVLNSLNYEIEKTGTLVSVKDLHSCYGDANQLNQLFTNIISNAIKYRHGDRPLEIVINGEKQFNRVVYSFRDNGLGISTRHLEKIWDVFFQVNPSKDSAGEGIGLSIVKRIVDKHRGRIRIESEEGTGSVFYIELLCYDFSE